MASRSIFGKRFDDRHLMRPIFGWLFLLLTVDQKVVYFSSPHCRRATHPECL